MRKSTSSSAGTAPSTATSARAGVTPGPARSCFSTNATSASTTRLAKRANGTSARFGKTPEARRKPHTGSSQAYAAWRALLVKPAFQPITRSPRATRASQAVLNGVRLGEREPPLLARRRDRAVVLARGEQLLDHGVGHRSILSSAAGVGPSLPRPTAPQPDDRAHEHAPGRGEQHRVQARAPDGADERGQHGEERVVDHVARDRGQRAAGDLGDPPEVEP